MKHFGGLNTDHTGSVRFRAQFADYCRRKNNARQDETNEKIMISWKAGGPLGQILLLGQAEEDTGKMQHRHR